jgi:hypothetical protein
VFLTGTALAQSPDIHGIAIVPLTIDKGFPLNLVLTEKLRSKLNEPVHAKIVDPVYAFDREVIPAGTQVLGKVTGLHPVGKWKRVSSMLGETPLHDPKSLSILWYSPMGSGFPSTSVAPDGNSFSVTRRADAHSRPRFNNPATNSAWSALGLSPYHPNSCRRAQHTKQLSGQLNFGYVLVGNVLNDWIPPPAGSIIYARLKTRQFKDNADWNACRCNLTYPLYSFLDQVYLSGRKQLYGEVADIHDAGFLARGEDSRSSSRKLNPNPIMSAKFEHKRFRGGLLAPMCPAI